MGQKNTTACPRLQGICQFLQFALPFAHTKFDPGGIVPDLIVVSFGFQCESHKKKDCQSHYHMEQRQQAVRSSCLPVVCASVRACERGVLAYASVCGGGCTEDWIHSAKACQLTVRIQRHRNRCTTATKKSAEHLQAQKRKDPC